MNPTSAEGETMPRGDATATTLATPGASFPEITFKTVTLKLTIAATFDLADQSGVAALQNAITAALQALDKFGNVSANYEVLK
jgi:hypothetical protein